jgi:predicted HAD superfamily Cof-like phosphohydrolase
MTMKKFDEPNGLNDVAAFHELFDLPVLDTPVIPDAKRCELRLSLLEEELEELKEAIEDGDLVEVADAFCDLQYVLSGAILEFGIAAKFKDLFDEVQRSNMSKACDTMEIAEATAKWYKENKGASSYIKPKGDKFLVYRENDGKVLKSREYSPADIESKLEA